MQSGRDGCLLPDAGDQPLRDRVRCSCIAFLNDPRGPNELRAQAALVLTLLHMDDGRRRGHTPAQTVRREALPPHVHLSYCLLYVSLSRIHTDTEGASILATCDEPPAVTLSLLPLLPPPFFPSYPPTQAASLSSLLGAPAAVGEGEGPIGSTPQARLFLVKAALIALPPPAVLSALGQQQASLLTGRHFQLVEAELRRRLCV